MEVPLLHSPFLSPLSFYIYFDITWLLIDCTPFTHARVHSLSISFALTAFQARLVICASKIIFSIESAKCKGFVLISDHSDASGASEEEREKVYGLYNVLFPMSNGGFPVTLRAIHRWNPPPIDLYEKIDYVVSKELRVRITHITGETQEERFSKLAEYGIAKSSLPDVIGGDAKRLEWMQCVDRMVTEELSRAESNRNNQSKARM